MSATYGSEGPPTYSKTWGSGLQGVRCLSCRFELLVLYVRDQQRGVVLGILDMSIPGRCSSYQFIPAAYNTRSTIHSAPLCGHTGNGKANGNCYVKKGKANGSFYGAHGLGFRDSQ